MKLLSITGISRGRNFFFGNSRYTRGMLRYGYCDECLSHETEMAHDRARWITANFITGSGLWLLSLSYAKIRLLVGGQNIVCGGYLRGGGRARVELSTKVRLRLPPSLPVLPCYLIVLLVRRDAPSWSRFSPPLPLRPSPVRDGPRSLLALSSPRRFFSLPLSPPPPFLATRPFLPLAQRSPNCVSFEL